MISLARNQPVLNGEWLKKSSAHLQSNPACSVCGWADNLHMKVNTISNVYTPGSDDLITHCCICDKVHRLEKAKGTLIFLPEIPQSELNWFYHSLWSFPCDSEEVPSHKIALDMLKRSLLNRANVLEDELEGLSDPKMMVIALSNVAQDNVQFTNNVISGIRYVPSDEELAAEISYFRQNIYSQYLNKDNTEKAPVKLIAEILRNKYPEFTGKG